MKNPIKNLVLLLGAVFISLTNLSAVETEPVGFITFDVNDNADTKVGIPLNPNAAFVGAVDSVATGVITITGTMPDVTTATHFVMVTSGTLEGNWYEVTASGASTVTVSEDLQTDGLLAADTFRVIPFWTLDTLFPLGGDLPTSASPAALQSSLFFNNLAGSGINIAANKQYAYIDDGAGGFPDGWYDLNNPGAGLQGDVVLSPATYLTVRNTSGGLISFVVTGNVPVFSVSNDVVSLSSAKQDNQIPNPFPSGVTLANSGLISSGAVRAAATPADPNRDALFVYAETPSTTNPAAAIEFAYIDDGAGGFPDGWYNINNPGAGLQDSYVLTPGAAIVIRRGADTDEVHVWKADVPYTL